MITLGHRFDVVFHRYSSATGVSRLSQRYHMSATDFAGAYDCASMMLWAMKDADLEHSYSLHSITCDGSANCQQADGARKWETMDEFSQRIAKERGAE